MPSDLHRKPVDEGTLAKLEIFEDYAAEWLPTFVMSGVPRVAIFDFFAGPGYDVNGVPGSAIRILRTVNLHRPNIVEKGTRIDVYLNEFSSKKLGVLSQACVDYLSANAGLTDVVDLHYSSDDFAVAFENLIPKMGNVPSLAYLDQNGIKAIGPTYFRQLADKPKTDFLYFVSSSYFWRFGESEEFRTHFDIDLAEAKKDPFEFIHRNVLGQIREGLPADTKIHLYPFSIKKGTNIHGIIFAASHPLAFDKFLRIAWKKNETNGEANFDIDDDTSKAQPDLWGQKPLTKLERFAKNLGERVIQEKVRNNSDALQFPYSEGHLGAHADSVLRAMKANGEITFDGVSPLVTYDNVYKQKRFIDYVLKIKK